MPLGQAVETRLPAARAVASCPGFGCAFSSSAPAELMGLRAEHRERERERGERGRGERELLYITVVSSIFL